MLLRRESKRNFRGLIIWSIIMAGIIFMFLSLYPELAKQQKGLDELMNTLPQGLKKAFGMDRLSMSSMLGYYGIRIHLMTTLLGSIYASLLASNIVAKEQQDKTIEFLLAKPVSRLQIIGHKLSCVIVNVLLFNLVITAASLLGFQLFATDRVSMQTFFLLESAVLLMHLTFASISFLLSAVVKRTRSVVSMTLGLVFIAYFFSIISDVSDQMTWLKYISPFKYAEAAAIITDRYFDPLYISIMVTVIVCCAASAYWYYRKKDITV